MVPVSLSVYYCCYLAAFVNFCFIYFIIIRIIYLCFNKLYTYFLMHLKSYICLNIADKCLLHSLLDLLLFIQQKCFLCLPINEIKVRHVIHIYIISISWNFASYINRTSSKVKGFWKTPFYPVHKAKQILKTFNLGRCNRASPICLYMSNHVLFISFVWRSIRIYKITLLKDCVWPEGVSWSFGQVQVLWKEKVQNLYLVFNIHKEKHWKFLLHIKIAFDLRLVMISTQGHLCKNEKKTCNFKETQFIQYLYIV